MKNVTVFNRISLDGFIAGPEGNVDWFLPDPDLDEAMHAPQATERPGTLLLGRRTYRLLESYWPGVAGDPSAPESARAMADDLNRMTKVVFSRTLQSVDWQNSELVQGDVREVMKRLHDRSEADAIIFGSGSLVRQLADVGAIDEYALVVTPLVLGEGTSLFGGAVRHALELCEARPFPSGNVLLRYRPAAGGRPPQGRAGS